MKRYLIRRVLGIFPIALAVVTVVFVVLRLTPGDPAEARLGEGAERGAVAALRAQMHLDRPLHEQYVLFIAGLLRGDFGKSWRTGEAVSIEIGERLTPTLELAAAAFLVALAIAFPLGFFAACRRDGWVDHVARFLALLGVSMPNFWLGPLLMILFALKLGWLPVSGREGFTSIILPAVTLGAALAAVTTRMLRVSLSEELRLPYVTTAVAKGKGRLAAAFQDGMKNALLPVVTLLGLQIGALLSGVIITETLFSWPGLGRLLIQAIQFRDYPQVQACVLVICMSYLLANLLTDVLYALLDPRIRYR